MGRIERTNMSLVIWTSFAPSKRWVVRCKTRVPMAYCELGMSETLRNRAYSESEMPCDKEDRVTEIEGGVQMVVVQDDGRGEDDPNGYDSCSRNFWFRSGNLCGDGGRQLFLCVLLCGQKLIGWLDERLFCETLVSRLLGGHGCGRPRESLEKTEQVSCFGSTLCLPNLLEKAWLHSWTAHNLVRSQYYTIASTIKYTSGARSS